MSTSQNRKRNKQNSCGISSVSSQVIRVGYGNKNKKLSRDSNNRWTLQGGSGGGSLSSNRRGSPYSAWTGPTMTTTKTKIASSGNNATRRTWSNTPPPVSKLSPNDNSNNYASTTSESSESESDHPSAQNRWSRPAPLASNATARLRNRYRQPPHRVPPPSVFRKLIKNKINKTKIKNDEENEDEQDYDDDLFSKEAERIRNERIQAVGDVVAEQVDTEAVEAAEDAASETQENAVIDDDKDPAATIITQNIQLLKMSNQTNLIPLSCKAASDTSATVNINAVSNSETDANDEMIKTAKETNAKTCNQNDEEKVVNEGEGDKCNISTTEVEAEENGRKKLILPSMTETPEISPTINYKNKVEDLFASSARDEVIVVVDMDKKIEIVDKEQTKNVKIISEARERTDTVSPKINYKKAGEDFFTSSAPEEATIVDMNQKSERGGKEQTTDANICFEATDGMNTEASITTKAAAQIRNDRSYNNLELLNNFEDTNNNGNSGNDKQQGDSLDTVNATIQEFQQPSAVGAEIDGDTNTSDDNHSFLEMKGAMQKTIPGHSSSTSSDENNKKDDQSEEIENNGQNHHFQDDVNSYEGDNVIDNNNAAGESSFKSNNHSYIDKTNLLDPSTSNSPSDISNDAHEVQQKQEQKKSNIIDDQKITTISDATKKSKLPLFTKDGDDDITTNIDNTITTNTATNINDGEDDFDIIDGQDQLQLQGKIDEEQHLQQQQEQRQALLENVLRQSRERVKDALVNIIQTIHRQATEDYFMNEMSTTAATAINTFHPKNLGLPLPLPLHNSGQPQPQHSSSRRNHKKANNTFSKHNTPSEITLAATLVFGNEELTNRILSSGSIQSSMSLPLSSLHASSLQVLIDHFEEQQQQQDDNVNNESISTLPLDAISALLDMTIFSSPPSSPFLNYSQQQQQEVHAQAQARAHNLRISRSSLVELLETIDIVGNLVIQPEVAYKVIEIEQDTTATTTTTTANTEENNSSDSDGSVGVQFLTINDYDDGTNLEDPLMPTASDEDTDDTEQKQNYLICNFQGGFSLPFSSCGTNRYNGRIVSYTLKDIKPERLDTVQTFFFHQIHNDDDNNNENATNRIRMIETVMIKLVTKLLMSRMMTIAILRMQTLLKRHNSVVDGKQGISMEHLYAVGSGNSSCVGGSSSYGSGDWIKKDLMKRMRHEYSKMIWRNHDRIMTLVRDVMLKNDGMPFYSIEEEDLILQLSDEIAQSENDGSTTIPKKRRQEQEKKQLREEVNKFSSLYIDILDLCYCVVPTNGAKPPSGISSSISDWNVEAEALRGMLLRNDITENENEDNDDIKTNAVENQNAAASATCSNSNTDFIIIGDYTVCEEWKWFAKGDKETQINSNKKTVSVAGENHHNSMTHILETSEHARLKRASSMSPAPSVVMSIVASSSRIGKLKQTQRQIDRLTKECTCLQNSWMKRCIFNDYCSFVLLGSCSNSRTKIALELLMADLLSVMGGGGSSNSGNNVVVLPGSKKIGKVFLGLPIQDEKKLESSIQTNAIIATACTTTQLISPPSNKTVLLKNLSQIGVATQRLVQKFPTGTRVRINPSALNYEEHGEVLGMDGELPHQHYCTEMQHPQDPLQKRDWVGIVVASFPCFVMVQLKADWNVMTVTTSKQQNYTTLSIPAEACERCDLDDEDDAYLKELTGGENYRKGNNQLGNPQDDEESAVHYANISQDEDINNDSSNIHATDTNDKISTSTTTVEDMLFEMGWDVIQTEKQISCRKRRIGGVVNGGRFRRRHKNRVVQQKSVTSSSSSSSSTPAASSPISATTPTAATTSQCPDSSPLLKGNNDKDITNDDTSTIIGGGEEARGTAATLTKSTISTTTDFSKAKTVEQEQKKKSSGVGRLRGFFRRRSKV